MSSNQDRITAFLRSKGMPAAGIAAVEGNLQVESGFDPLAWNPNEHALGLAQWEGGRLTNLQNFATSSGGSAQSLDTQLGFLWSELTGSEPAVLQTLMTATDPAPAAAAFDAQFERSSGGSRATRVADAQAIFAGGLVGGSGGSAGSGSSSTGGGGGGTTATPAGFLGIDLASMFRPIGKILIDTGLVIAGLVMLVVAFVIIAKAGNDGTSSPAAPDTAPVRVDDDEDDDEDQADDEPAPAHHHRKAAVADTEDVGEAAAL